MADHHLDYDQVLEDVLLSEVSRDNLMEWTGKIATWVRLSGATGEAEAMNYVNGILKSFGYRTELLRHPAFISLPVSASLTIPSDPQAQFKCITHSFAKSTAKSGLSGELIYPKKGDCVRGKIVLVDGMASSKACLEMEAGGAIGEIFVSDDYLHESAVSPLWGPPTRDTLGMLPVTPSITVTCQGGDYLKNAIARGPVQVRIHTAVDTGWRQLPLLIADIDGREEGEFLLFSSHIDSWHYGAMDNGAANATVMEVARLAAEHRSSLRRGLRLAFWSGHSHGRFAGSAWYADHYWTELLDRCLGHVNADSTGGRGASVLEEIPIMPQSFGLAAAALKKVTGRNLAGKRIGRFGDQSFYGIGLTSTFATFSEQPRDPGSEGVGFHTGGKLSGGLGWWWHTEFDTIDKIDPDNLLRDTRIYMATVYRLLSCRYLPYDFRALCRYISEQLDLLSRSVGQRLDLEPARARLSEVARTTERFYEVLGRGEIEPPKANRVLRELSLALVPCAFKENERTDPDFFGAIPAFPMFDGAERLASAEGDEFNLLYPIYLRRRNRFILYLTEAVQALERAGV
ncbi:MAG: M28 family peptidase [Firmicutes bacterium]|nr:M28 family peptidase [Bacillota bacterium]